MEKEKVINALKDVGFTEGESNVYLSLLRIGESKVGAIIKSSGISRSKAYDILERLIKKGIAGKVDKNGILFYRALEPSKILNLIEEKKRRLNDEEVIINELLPTLNSISSKKEVKVSVYEGYEGFKYVIDKTINELKKEDSYDVMGISKTTVPMSRYAMKIYQAQVVKKFKARSIFDEFGMCELPTD